LLLPALGSPVAPPVTCCSGQAASSPEFEVPRPPPGSPRRARASACSPSQWALVAPPLGHTEALCTTHCSAEPSPSPDFAPPRSCCPCAAAARRRPLRSSYHCQSLRGELNRRLVPLVGQLRRPLAGSELPCAVGTPVQRFHSCRVLGVKSQGRSVRFRKFQGSDCKMDLPLLCALTGTCKFSIKS
jgi:hypothetical protein